MPVRHRPSAAPSMSPSPMSCTSVTVAGRTASAVPPERFRRAHVAAGDERTPARPRAGRCGSSPTRRGACTPPPRLRRARGATAHRPEAAYRSSRHHCDCSETTTGTGCGGGGAGVVATTGGGGATATGAGAAGIVVASGTIVDVGAALVDTGWWWRRPPPPTSPAAARAGLAARSDQSTSATRPSRRDRTHRRWRSCRPRRRGGAGPGTVLVGTPSSHVADPPPRPAVVVVAVATTTTAATAGCGSVVVAATLPAVVFVLGLATSPSPLSAVVLVVIALSAPARSGHRLTIAPTRLVRSALCPT